MKKKILLSLLALVLGVPAVALLSGAFPVFAVPCLGAAGEEVYSGKPSRKELAASVFGRIQFVDYGEDFKVRIASWNGDADKTIDIVTGDASSSGKWKIVSRNPDYKIRIVHCYEDFSVFLRTR